MPDTTQVTQLLESALERPFGFREQPVPTPAEYRPKWRTALVVLLIDACYGRRASWHQLHVLNWASRSRTNQQAFERLKAGQAELGGAVVRYDPALDRAIDFALFDGLVERRSGEVLGLSPRGLATLVKLERLDVLAPEREFLDHVSPVSQRFVDSLVPRRPR
jgi:hypothetical protein